MKETYFNPYHDPDKLETLADHPVFNDIFNIQAELDTERFDTLPEAHSAGIETVQAIHGLLEAAGLIGKEVSLTGFDIIMPTIAYDAATGVEVQRSETIDASTDFFAEHPPVEGEFYGFHHVIKLDVGGGLAGEYGSDVTDSDLLDPDTEDDIDALANTKFRVTLHYRVCIQEGAVLSNFVGSFFALGSISDTHILFNEDKQAQDAARALNILADASLDAPAAAMSAELDTLLTPTDDETIYKTERLHKISETIKDHEREQGINRKYRDAVLDLVTARLGAYPGAAFEIEAEHGFLRREDKTLFTQDSFDGYYAILGITFAPQYTVEDGKATPTGEESLAVVIDSTTDGENSIHCYIPFQNITTFAPLAASESK